MSSLKELEQEMPQLWTFDSPKEVAKSHCRAGNDGYFNQ